MDSSAQLQIDAANALVRNEQLKMVAKYLLAGAGGGAAVAGGAALGRGLVRKLRPPKSTYTSAVEGPVYTPKAASLPIGPSAISAASAATKALPAVGNPVADAANNSTFAPSMKILAALVGMPLGYAATKSLTDRSESFRRSQELENMQREYEQALQEYAATKATGKARKRASLQQMAMDRLVENTVQLSQKLALIEQPRRILMNYAILAPILGGALGFMNGMGSGDSRSLAVAEARLQHAREKTNPTGSTISVAQIDAPNKDGQLSDADRKKQLRQQLVDDALDDIDTSYVE